MWVRFSAFVRTTIALAEQWRHVSVGSTGGGRCSSHTVIKAPVGEFGSRAECFAAFEQWMHFIMTYLYHTVGFGARP